MALLATLRNDLKDAIQKKEATRLSTLRLLFAAIQNKEIEERKKDTGLGEDEILEVITKEAKKRKDAISEYKKANRNDLASQEEEELHILEQYLPQELPEEDIVRVLRDGIREIGAGGMKDFGALMKIVMPHLKGKASGDRISQLAKSELERL